MFAASGQTTSGKSMSEYEPYAHSVELLLKQLPPLGDIGHIHDLDNQSRWVLRLALSGDQEVTSVLNDPRACPNCGAPCAFPRTPYCSEQCKEVSAFVRQVRRVLSDFTEVDQERQASLGQVLWHLIGGGYPRRVPMILEQSKLQIRKKQGTQCFYCESEATTFDHIKTACNRPINLRQVCQQCRRTRDFGDQAFLAQPAVQDLLKSIRSRILAIELTRACDDPNNWDWRAFLNQRNSLLNK